MRTTYAGCAAGLVLALAASACGPLHHGSAGGGTRGAGASCVGPMLGVRPFRALPDPAPVSVRPRQPLRVIGKWFTRDCFDTGAGGTERPVPVVRLVLVTSDHRSTLLATAHPGGQTLGFDVRVHLPADAPPGRARIVGRPFGAPLGGRPVALMVRPR